MRILTEQERELASDNFHLARAYSRKYRRPLHIDQDQWESYCMEALCYCATKWEPDGGRSFLSYYHLIVQSRWRQLVKNYNPKGTLARSIGITDIKNSLGLTSFDFPINHDFSYLERKEDSEFAKTCLDMIDGDDKKVLSMYINGGNIKGIAKKIGMCRERATKIFRRSIDRIRTMVLE